MTQAKSQQHIVHQQLALDTYLRTLLDDISDVPVQTEEKIAPRIQSVAQAVVLAEPKIVPSRPVTVSKSLMVSEQNKFVEPENPTKLQALSVMPEWSRNEFQALFFKVEHLILATPLTELSRTIKTDRKPGKIPGQPSWFMGLLDDQDSRIGVLDTGQLIFGKSRGSQRDLEKDPFKCILVTQDKRWGLACDEILSIGRLKPEKVRWRTGRQKRPWLIGTVIDELTAIIDVQALVPHRKRDI